MAFFRRPRIICPYCLTEIRGSKNVQTCPTCKTELPVQYVDDYDLHPPFFAQVFGWSRVGKTVFLSGLTLMLIVVTLLPMVSLDSGDWLRIGMIMAMSLIYLSLFFLFGLFISSRVHKPETALVLILLVWMIWVIGVPNFSSLIARRIYPVPTEDELQIQKAHIQADSEHEHYEQCWRMNDEALRMMRN